jgi:hypothetical protein
VVTFLNGQGSKNDIELLPRLVLFVQLQDSTQNRQEKELGLWQNYVDSYINTSPRKL